MAVTIKIDATDDEIERWGRLADAAGVDLATWVRDAARQVERSPGHARPFNERMATVERAVVHPVRLDLPPLEDYLSFEGDRFGDLPET